jgi:hypothetical protein
MKFLAALLMVLLGVAAAFFRPAVPFQLESSRGCDTKSSSSMDMMMKFDEGLDNADVEEDTNITPARKCGFCIGVSILSISVFV